MLGLTVVTMAQNVPSYVPSNGLVGWWPFNGNANDESGNGNDGDVNGATLTEDRFENAQSAHYFNGNSDISITISNLPISAEPRTISAWLKWDSTQTVWDNRIVNYGYCPAFTNNQTFGLSIWDNLNPGNPTNAKIILYSCGTSDVISDLTPNRNWHNAVASYDGTIQKLYFDGVLIDSMAFTLSTSSSSIFVIGSSSDLNGTGNFEGKIDDIGIWNRALTQQEISDLYNGCQLSVNTQPTNQTINVNNNAQFIAGSSDPSATFQWQTDLGVGFQNLNSVGQYSGTTNDTLTVANIMMTNNNQPFRCIINYDSCSDTSNVAVLTVNNNVRISEFTDDNLFYVYPNPAQTVINLKADSKLIGEPYTVIDNTGRVVLSGIIVSENPIIELSDFSNGVYLFQVKDNLNQSFRIIKN